MIYQDVITLRKPNKEKTISKKPRKKGQQQKGDINLRDTIPFYSRYGFMIDQEF